MQFRKAGKNPRRVQPPCLRRELQKGVSARKRWIPQLEVKSISYNVDELRMPDWIKIRVAHLRHS